MDEKNHLGAKLQLKERVAEDQYFAERDREALAKLNHAQEAEHEHSIRGLARGRCPHCGHRLHQHPIHDEMIDACPSCQGTWLSKAQWETVSYPSGDTRIRKFLEGLTRLMQPPHS
jgi:predicted Zn-ribbon and HTH transcriptional regulator